jgi:CrcB protein
VLPIDPDLDAAARRADPKVIGSIGLGGFLGALARYEVGLALPTRAGGFPTATFLTNTSGAFVIGLMLTVILERFPSHPYLRPLTCIGFLGAWTTVSTFVTESAVLVKDGHASVAVAYMVATIVCGLSGTTVGIALARRWAPS